MKIPSSRPKRLEISKLIPTHNRLRDISRLKAIKYTKFSPPSISLVDDDYYVHDGHHRLVCMIHRGEKYICDFDLKEFNSEEYNEISFENGYVTPFDVIEECRLPDFYKFKEVIMRMIGINPEKEIRNIINKYRFQYCEDRYTYSMDELYYNVKFAL